MTIPKKGTRKLTVDGSPYRWIINHRSPCMNLVVVSDERSGQRLSVRFDEELVITPGVVSHVIGFAIENGWQPKTSKLGTLYLNGNEIVQNTEFEKSHPDGARWEH